MGFILERVMVSMEKCSPYIYGMEDLFFCRHLKKEVPIIFTSFFLKHS